MIHSHVKNVATYLNEEKYQVKLPERYSHENESFEDGEAYEPAWLKNVWQSLFKTKLNTSNINIPPGSNILDVCCGRGFLGEYFLQKDMKVTFCDISPLQLEELRARFVKNNLRAKVLEGDLLDLPFPENEFDFVVGNSFLHHLQDVPKGLSEIARVLKIGGKLIVFHEPAVSANYWETFPLSIFKDTRYTTGFTDLWQFEEKMLKEAIKENGFESPEIMGSGIISSVLLNWYFIVTGKLGISTRWMLEPILRMRAILYKIEFPIRKALPVDSFPSLFISATRTDICSDK